MFPRGERWKHITRYCGHASLETKIIEKIAGDEG